MANPKVTRVMVMSWSLRLPLLPLSLESPLLGRSSCQLESGDERSLLLSVLGREADHLLPHYLAQSFDGLLLVVYWCFTSSASFLCWLFKVQLAFDYLTQY